MLETTGATLGTSVGELAQGNVIGAGSSLVTNVGKTAVTSVTAVARVGVGAVREAVRGIGSTVEGATKVDPTQLLEPYLGWVQVCAPPAMHLLAHPHRQHTSASTHLCACVPCCSVVGR